MVPDGVAAVAAFLGFIAPGVLFEVRTAPRRPPRKHTALVEVGRAVLISTACTGAVGLLVLLGWKVWGPGVTLVEMWEIDSDLVLIGALTGVAAACGLAFGAASWSVRKSQDSIVGRPPLLQALDRSPSGAHPYLRIAMTDGTTWHGRSGSHSIGIDDEHPWVELTSPLYRRRKDAPKPVELTTWTSVVLPQLEAAHILVTHTATEASEPAGQPTPSTPAAALSDPIAS